MKHAGTIFGEACDARNIQVRVSGVFLERSGLQNSRIGDLVSRVPSALHQSADLAVYFICCVYIFVVKDATSAYDKTSSSILERSL